MDKYCTFIVAIKARQTRLGQSRICGDIAVSPHPILPNSSLCRRHLLDCKKYLAGVQTAHGTRRSRTPNPSDSG